MWIVVSFDDDNTVECVPNFWYKNNLCAWPNKTVKNHTKMIERRYNPNNLEFDFFKARILTKNIDNLSEARRKAKLAEETSELSSAANYDKESRKIRHKKLNSSSEEISCNENREKNHRLSQKKNVRSFSILDNPPLFNVDFDEDSSYEHHHNPINQKTTSMHSGSPKKAHKNLVDGLTSPTENLNVSQKEIHSTNSNDRQFGLNSMANTPGSSKISKKGYYNNSSESWSSSPLENLNTSQTNIHSKNSYERQLSLIENTPGSSKISGKVINTESCLSSPSGNWNVTQDNSAVLVKSNRCKRRIDFNSIVNTHPDSSKVSNDRNIKNTSNEKIDLLLRAVTNLKYEMREHGIKIERLEQTIVNNCLNKKMIVDYNDNTTDDMFDFPIKTLEELSIFEDKLMDNNFRLQMINYLSRLERPKVADMTRQIMAKVFHNNILSVHSYIGQKKKNVFSVLNSCSLIFATIRNIPKHRNCTDLEIVGPLKMYMANAKFREEKKQQSISNA
ncbi:unnamed protein product [Macrosiphum euphorbiae]|uniref:DUF4806 domain-containing protein n=1 Tax=Macrosiphum euphorbiae TaxID=13131 RepID=A0AAV0Y0T8_9HEMI|nr:unnamed protein product [Macrosiphum euphorbiae]